MQAEEARTTKLYFPKTWDNISSDGASQSLLDRGYPSLADSVGEVAITAKHFVRWLLTVDESKRPSIEEALEHPVRGLCDRNQPNRTDSGALSFTVATIRRFSTTFSFGSPQSTRLYSHPLSLELSDTRRTRQADKEGYD